MVYLVQNKNDDWNKVNRMSCVSTRLFSSIWKSQEDIQMLIFPTHIYLTNSLYLELVCRFVDFLFIFISCVVFFHSCTNTFECINDRKTWRFPKIDEPISIFIRNNYITKTWNVQWMNSSNRMNENIVFHRIKIAWNFGNNKISYYLLPIWDQRIRRRENIA